LKVDTTAVRAPFSRKIEQSSAYAAVDRRPRRLLPRDFRVVDVHTTWSWLLVGNA